LKLCEDYVRDRWQLFLSNSQNMVMVRAMSRWAYHVQLLGPFESTSELDCRAHLVCAILIYERDNG
jgi:hypothetical protein